ncbi:MAG TPA: 3'-5' exonuclease, partial [Candidatus Aminicenantes bacterium]|nr:3'-5' exonuclease [Candidatus Aminicenantes bacterium]
VDNQEELAQALEFPWEKWAIFLHPAQRQLVEADFQGPARVAGSAGTGKTIVALHRTAYLTKTNPDSRVLLTTFSDPLANALKTKLRELLWSSPKLAERLDVISLNSLGKKLYEIHFGKPQLASQESIDRLLEKGGQRIQGRKYSLSFLRSEWKQVVDAWQLNSWEEYRDVRRLGRKTRLSEERRRELWGVFEGVQKEFAHTGLVTRAGMFARLAAFFTENRRSPFDYCVVDEAQDIEIGHLRFLAAMAGERPNGLFFAGDLGQRIFQTPFSWKAVGVDVRGRSKTLRINYRTSHQIRQQADRLLEAEISDVDGNVESRCDAQSVFNGPDPVIVSTKTPEQEIEAVGQWLADRIREGLLPPEIAVFVRSDLELDRAIAAVKFAGLSGCVLDKKLLPVSESVSLATMHLAKGLEFRAVAVMACDEGIIPSQKRLETAGETSDLQEIYNTERQLLYVAITRARDHLLVSSGGEPSEFVDDLTSR